MSVYLDHRGSSERRLFVGIDQGTGHVGSLGNAGERGNVVIRYGTLSDGAGAGMVSAYLSEAAQVPVRWKIAPVVTYSGAANNRDFTRLIRAVQLVNMALPEGRKMRIDSSAPMADPENGIHVEFVLESDFQHPDAWGIAQTFWEGSQIVRSRITVNEAYALVPEKSTLGPIFDPPDWGLEQVNRQGTIVLAHELMHALGITNTGGDHVPQSFDSIMKASDFYEPGEEQPLSLLYPVDREALRVLYGEFDDDDSLSDFGPWASSSLHIAGNGHHANFGVALRNGYAEPWAYGLKPTTTLANNAALSGSATWTGTLLGLTPDAAVVAGDAEIGVNLGTLTGRADFTSLEAWGANQAPGEAGSGTTWLDGDLGYVIAVSGNTFRETGGDTGTLTGIFTGRQHEGAAGTLERSDLTAAFGASR